MVGLAALTSVLMVTYASRGDGQWEVMDDPMSWVWMALAAFAMGFWGYGSILVSALSPKKLGSVMFIVLGVLYLLFVALVGYEEFQYGSDFDLAVQSVIVAIGSSIVMIPLMLVVMFIGRMAG